MDLTGVKFGKYTVIVRKSVSPDLWNCECECGRHRNMSTTRILAYIRRNENVDCGYCRCYKGASEASITRRKYFSVLKGMKSRCFNPKHPAYKYYGGRGIVVCEEWRNNFNAFYDYITKLDHFNESGRSIDRINNNEGYFPGNIRFATAKEQANNRRKRKCTSGYKKGKRSTEKSNCEVRCKEHKADTSETEH